LGEEMPKGKKKKDQTSTTDKVIYSVMAILIVLLFLKGIGILKALFNLDPSGITLNIDVGYITSAVLFGIVIEIFYKQNNTLSKQGERIARIEGILEGKNKTS
jgi:uncharacterized membrane protein